jgi:hypothetical protein
MFFESPRSYKFIIYFKEQYTYCGVCMQHPTPQKQNGIKYSPASLKGLPARNETKAVFELKHVLIFVAAG